MLNLQHFPWKASFLLLLGAVTPYGSSLPVFAQESSPNSNFPNVTDDYWATPFIEALAARNIVVGYPDGTYRPQESVDRDEFAAMIQKAFDQEQVRRIPSGSAFTDVPQGYWAAQPIEEAYEMGFMSGYPQGYFYPRKPISKVEAVTALVQGLGLTLDQSQGKITAAQTLSPPAAVTPADPVTPPSAPPTTLRANRRPRLSLGEGLWALASGQVQFQPARQQAQATIPTPSTTSPAPTLDRPRAEQPSTPTPTKISAAGILNQYYTDANRIPAYAIAGVAAATQQNMVVNYPDSNVFNPEEIASRGMAAALIYQALVYQNKLEPLPNSVSASQYIVDRSETVNPDSQVP